MLVAFIKASWEKAKLKLISIKNRNFVATSNLEIPQKVYNEELIVRILLHPKANHLSSNGKCIKWNAYRTPADIDEVSVIRLNFCNANFCKRWGKQIENIKEGRKYFGMGVLITSEIRELEADVVYTPITKGNQFHEKNLFHADIKVGYIPEKGVSLPPEIKYKIEKLAQKARLYEDPEPNITEWVGPELL